MRVARSELILGGQKSGKSRRAERLAQAWLAERADRRAVLIATGQAHDEEMRARIARHQRERAQRLPRMQTVEEPRDLAGAIARHGEARTLLVVDCLTLWLTHWLMPAGDAMARKYEEKTALTQDWQAQSALFLEALKSAPGPIVLVGNEIGLGVIPLGAEVRAFVDALGVLNQRVAAACERVTLMVAGIPVVVKGGA
ncbi:MAG: bifunctional adenosylcobinamide kinase/adenosylcobinamide-phosphate guanylyltransferase [Burkholderiales bacterium]|nr:bifunctional adenosylcobinamide kinase/adenosylcobinamide-phosphate guanylyltransferase [Burkholderiales bacterium]